MRLDAERKWPQLYRFLAGNLHGDRDIFHGSPESALDAAVRDYSFEMLKQVAREWCDWNATAGAVDDIRPMLNEGLGVNVLFKTPIDARNFMNLVYDKVIVAIREDEKGWKPR